MPATTTPNTRALHQMIVQLQDEVRRLKPRPILQSSADALLALAVLSGRLDVALLGGMDDPAKRRAWAERIAAQIIDHKIDVSPPAPPAPEVAGLLDAASFPDRDRREAAKRINDYRRDKAAGRAATIGGIPRDLLAELAPDLAASIAGAIAKAPTGATPAPTTTIAPDKTPGSTGGRS